MRELTSAELEAVSGGATMDEWGLIGGLIVADEHAVEQLTRIFGEQ